jgi:hypothetical protein
VITPEGVLYDKEHILQCLLHQKKDIARKLKVYEGQEAKEQVKAVSDQHLAHEEHVAQFHRDNHGAGMYSEVDHGTAAAAGEVAGEGGEKHVATSADVAATQFDKERMKTMKAFWAGQAPAVDTITTHVCRVYSGRLGEGTLVPGCSHKCICHSHLVLLRTTCGDGYICAVCPLIHLPPVPHTLTPIPLKPCPTTQNPNP